MDRATAGFTQQASQVKVARAKEGALAHNSIRLMNAGDANDMVPLALKVSGLKGAGVVPVMGGIGLEQCCTRTHAGQGGKQVSKIREGSNSQRSPLRALLHEHCDMDGVRWLEWCQQQVAQDLGSAA